MGDLSRDFSRREFACSCGCGFDTVDAALLTALQELRDYYGQVVTITSGARCRDENIAAGGAPNSQHLRGRAADFVVAGVRAPEVQAYLSMKYHDRWGIGRADTYTHLDTRTGPLARWSY